MKQSLTDRFEAKYSASSYANCWPWLGAHHGKGYGHFQLKGKCEKAQRVSYSLYVGDLKPGLLVMHKCDNPPCVNPAHLFLGTNAENMADMKAKGRGNGPRGVAQHLSKLTEQDVREIRATPPRNGRKLAARYGVSPTTISAIRKRQTWGHVQ